MRRWRMIMAAALAAWGCDRPRAQPQPAPPSPTVAPATQPANPATRPVDRMANTVLLIDGKSVAFPPARVVVVQAEPLELVLHTDDPAEALGPNYEGNRYYLSLKFPHGNLSQLSGLEIPLRAASLERRDEPDGIFLDGDRRQLQPYDVRVGFTVRGSQATVNINGQFVQFMTRDDAAPPRTVLVQGVVLAELKSRKR